MRERRERGITLIALAVTIVVMLILAGVTIDITLGDKGIINKAKEAAEKMNSAVEQDEAELNELLNELNEVMNSEWDSNIEIPGGNNETGGGGEDSGGESAGDLFDDGTIQPGDYVAYTPTGLESYVVNGNYSGTGMNQTVTKEELNWRVLDKTQEGKLRLISATPTETTVKLQVANGYNNAVYILDELCNTLYKGENATAKSLKIEDIQNKMNLSVWNYNNAASYGSTFNPSNKQYPLMFAQEMGQIVNGRSGSLDLSEQPSIMTGTGTASTWTVKYTYWDKHSMGASNYVDPMYHELFHTAATGTYWLSSRCVSAVSSRAHFYVRCVSSSYVNAVHLFSSDGSNYSNTYRVRPVVYLESNVKIDTDVAGANGGSPDTAWVIK